MENRKRKMNRESKCGNSLLEGPGSKEERLESQEWLHLGLGGTPLLILIPPVQTKGLRELKVREGNSAQAEL